MIALAAEAAALATAAYVAGWRGALFAVACIAVGHVAGHLLALDALRRAGYVVEYRADGRGVRRWRVGVKDAPAVPVAEPVTWIVPSGKRQAPQAGGETEHEWRWEGEELKPSRSGIPPQPRPILPTDHRG